mmetsp:Transcript_39659/g.106357  ORF Transcript_39659/g.106357 Transcript_39659/m.106357 type:complete len:280 (-) Transcript_39659:412-1251(-)
MVFWDAASAVLIPVANVTPGDRDTTLRLRPAAATVVRMACLKTLRRTSWEGIMTRHLWPATPKELARALQTPAEVPTTTLLASSPAACRLVSIFTASSTSSWSITARTMALLSLRFVMSAMTWCSLLTCWGQSRSKKLGSMVSQLNALKRLAIGASPALSAKHCSIRCCSLFTLNVDSRKQGSPLNVYSACAAYIGSGTMFSPPCEAMRNQTSSAVRVPCKCTSPCCHASKAPSMMSAASRPMIAALSLMPVSSRQGMVDRCRGSAWKSSMFTTRGAIQ